jgi:hypothetical protein
VAPKDDGISKQPTQQQKEEEHNRKTAAGHTPRTPAAPALKLHMVKSLACVWVPGVLLAFKQNEVLGGIDILIRIFHFRFDFVNLIIIILGLVHCLIVTDRDWLHHGSGCLFVLRKKMVKYE